MKTIVLTGMPGSGKTSVGKFVAEKTGRNFIDVDEQIVLSEKKSINEIFNLQGEKYFRNIEAQIIKKFFKNNNLIISLGGGAFENETTREFLLKNSFVIYLKTSPAIIYDRSKNSTDRPLLNNNMNLGHLNKLINSRKKNYELAHFTLITDNKNIDVLGSEIITQCANLK